MPNLSTKNQKPTSLYESVFSLNSLTMKKDFAWYLNINLKLTLPQSFREYIVKMSVNEKPYEYRIAQFEAQIKDLETESTLFPDGSKKQVANIKKQIKSVEQELADMRETCPEFEFAGIIEALAYKVGDTQITLRIPADVVNKINEHRLLLDNYKVELIRE